MGVVVSSQIDAFAGLEFDFNNRVWTCEISSPSCEYVGEQDRPPVSPMDGLDTNER